jgi:hypothetical protein
LAVIGSSLFSLHLFSILLAPPAPNSLDFLSFSPSSFPYSFFLFSPFIFLPRGLLFYPTYTAYIGS